MSAFDRFASLYGIVKKKRQEQEANKYNQYINQLKLQQILNDLQKQQMELEYYPKMKDIEYKTKQENLLSTQQKRKQSDLLFPIEYEIKKIQKKRQELENELSKIDAVKKNIDINQALIKLNLLKKYGEVEKQLQQQREELINKLKEQEYEQNKELYPYIKKEHEIRANTVGKPTSTKDIWNDFYYRYKPQIDALKNMERYKENLKTKLIDKQSSGISTPEMEQVYIDHIKQVERDMENLKRQILIDAKVKGLDENEVKRLLNINEYNKQNEVIDDTGSAIEILNQINQKLQGYNKEDILGG